MTSKTDANGTGKSMSAQNKTTWTVSVQDAQDGSGDTMLEFPDELINLLGWQIGDVLDVQWSADKLSLILNKIETDSRGSR